VDLSCKSLTSEVECMEIVVIDVLEVFDLSLVLRTGSVETMEILRLLTLAL